MNTLLLAINAKYIHSNPAVYNLKACAKEFEDDITIAEHTINEYPDSILREIVKVEPALLAVSCYIWNICHVEEILENFHKIRPEVPIWLGGPEVSYETKKFLLEHPYVTGIMCGEGEETFYKLLVVYNKYEKIKVLSYTDSCNKNIEQDLEDTNGIAFRKNNGEIIETMPGNIVDMDSIPFVYNNIKTFENKIIYYESSRGCPFSCSYCLSSVDKRLRFRSIDKVKKELLFFINHDVLQIKFVDRTFNCDRKRARNIWSFLIENDKGITNFHFEIAADLLEDEDFEIFKKMRPGLIQLEIGVQSTNKDTLNEIRRTTDLSRLSKAALLVNANKNIHQHLDLIAGLPFEDFESFRNSFKDVFHMKPNQLQLGFLKVLKGSYMYEKAKEYDIVYMSRAPYEVLSTKWLSYEEITRLKGIEEMVEVYYNSDQFSHTLEMLLVYYDNPFDFFDELAEFYEKNGYNKRSHSRISRYEILREFISERFADKINEASEWLVFDLYARENLKSRPAFARDLSEYKDRIFDFYKKEEQNPKYLKDYANYNFKQMLKMTHIEIFRYIDGQQSVYLFDYKKRSLIDKEVFAIRIDL